MTADSRLSVTDYGAEGDGATVTAAFQSALDACADAGGGTVVVPAFAIGRTQEMLLICEAYDIPCYVDGMGKGVTEMLRRQPEFVRDPDALRRAKSHARFVTGRDGQRKRITDQKAAIVTTSGMLGNEDPLAVGG